MSEENCIKITGKENGTPVEKTIVGMEMHDKECGYEINNLITVDHSVFAKLKQFPILLSVLTINRPLHSVGEKIIREGYPSMIVKTVSVNEWGFSYYGVTSAGYDTYSEVHLHLSSIK